MALVDPKNPNRPLSLVDISAMIARGEADVDAGRVSALDELLAEWEAEDATGRALGLPDDDGTPSAEYRRILHEEISAGLAAARAGRLEDGEAVFARIHAKLHVRERQDRG